MNLIYTNKILKYISLLTLAVIMISFSSCSLFTKAEAPEKVADRFFNYFNNYEYVKAKELATENTRKVIGFVEKLQTLGGGNKIIIKDNKTELIKTEKNGRETVLTYRKYSGGEQKVYLVKNKGKWLVDLRKDIPVKNPDNQINDKK